MAPIEYLGILATLFVLVSFTSSNKVFIRTVNSIGSVLFVIYGLNLGAHSVWILNSAVIVVNLYKLYKERKQSKVQSVTVTHVGDTNADIQSVNISNSANFKRK